MRRTGQTKEYLDNWKRVYKSWWQEQTTIGPIEEQLGLEVHIQELAAIQTTLGTTFNQHLGIH